MSFDANQEPGLKRHYRLPNHYQENGKFQIISFRFLISLYKAV